MGRDNHPKNRQARQLARKEATRKSYDRILIVCEGSKTEPNYFNEIRIFHRLQTTDVKVLPSQLGTSPKQIVEFAFNLFKNGDTHLKIKKCAFEQVYAVFDRDEHQSYHQALEYAESLSKKDLKNDQKETITFKAIPSVPNFELWFLLHFKLIQHRIDRKNVLQELKQYLSNYEKGKTGYFNETRSYLPKALSNARKIKKNGAHNGEDPYTEVGELVQILTSMKEES